MTISTAYHGIESITFPTSIKNRRKAKTKLLTIPLAVTPIITAFIIGWLILPILVKREISNKVALSPEVNPELYYGWLHPPIPMHLHVYLFNVTNPSEIISGASPLLKQVGPYVFRLDRKKFIISQDDLQDTITYEEKILHYFSPKLSTNVGLNDTLTIINVPFVGAALKISGFPSPIDGLARTILAKYKEPLFIQRSADQILFTGWKVLFLQQIDDEFGINVIPNNTFSLFMNQNNTLRGPFTVSRGILDTKSFGNILLYKNKTSLNVWPDPLSTCNKIDGTDGSIFPPPIKKNSVLKLFNPEICRSLYLTFNETKDFEGISAYRFKVPLSVIEDARISEENKCFCYEDDIKEENGECLKQGALNLSPCRDEAPVAISNPNFLDATKEYIGMGGLAPPNREEHESYIDVEPNTGIFLRESTKGQINLILKKVKGFKALNKMLFPLVRMDQEAKLDEEYIKRFKMHLSLLWWANFIGRFGVLGIAVIISGFIIIKVNN